jgi:hypothetical protein
MPGLGTDWRSGNRLEGLLLRSRLNGETNEWRDVPFSETAIAALGGGGSTTSMPRAGVTVKEEGRPDWESNRAAERFRARSAGLQPAGGRQPPRPVGSV